MGIFSTLAKGASSISPVGWAALGLDVANGIGSMLSQSATNRANKQMFEKQLQQNWDMMKSQQIYNSPVTQRKMLEDAGYSPYSLFMQNGQSSSGIGQTASAPTMQSPFNGFAPNMFDSVSNRLAQSSQVTAQNQKTQAETNLLNTDLETRRMSNIVGIAQAMSTIENIAADTNNKKVKNDLDALYLKFKRQVYNFEVNQVNLQNHLTLGQINQTAAESANLAADTAIKHKQYAWFDKINDANMRLSIANASAAYAAGNLSYEQAKTQVTTRIKMRAEKYGLDISNRVADETADFLINESYFNMMRNQLGFDFDVDRNNYYHEYGTTDVGSSNTIGIPQVSQRKVFYKIRQPKLGFSTSMGY